MGYSKSALILLLSFLLMGAADMAGVDTEGVGAGAHTIINLTSCEDLVIAYWDLDETGTNTRVADYGSCADAGSDCDLTAETGVDSTTGLRSNALRTDALSTEYVSCTTCDELQFNGENYTTITFINATSALNNWWGPYTSDGTDGYSFLCIDWGDSDNGKMNPTIGAAVDLVDYCDGLADADGWTYMGMSWDDSTDQVYGFVSNNTAGWQASGAQSHTGPVATSTAPFRLGYQTGFSASQAFLTDETSVISGDVTEEWHCFICSCYLDGSNCSLAGLGYSDDGHNSTYCGNCTLPSYTDSQECPSF